MDQANHFSFIGECTEKGRLIVKMASEAPICSETGTRSRADIHTEISAKIGNFLSENL